MSISWTFQQNKAIEVRGHNTLISAAAGSGKTTVLVERVIRMVTDNENPVDLDDLLIVTFTRAAAAQMKEKIRHAVTERLKSEPENEFLRRQFMKIDTANISTLDALCRRLLSENSEESETDSSLKTASENELAVLRDRVLDETLEEFYAEASPDFLKLVDSYMDRDDKKIGEMVLKLHRFSKSHPWPNEWLSSCARIYNGVDSISWLTELEDYVNSVISGCIRDARKAEGLSNVYGGPAHYADVLRADIESLEAFKTADFDGRVKLLCGEEKFFAALPRGGAGSLDIDPEIREKVKKLRDHYKDRITKLGEDIYNASLDEKLETIKKCAKTAECLTSVVMRFSDNFLAAKFREGVVDFNDIEHFALDTLVKKDESGGLVYTESADRLAKHFKEIIVDEYQDTNELQEEIIKALSGERFGRSNIYMVGDVKQSIYGFRQAEPELFNKKYNTYTGDSRVILGDNFRSRKNILNFVNTIFSRIMIPEVGGIDYTDGNELSCGAKYEGFDPEVEVTFISAKAKEGRETAAELIVNKIEELNGNFTVQDKDGIKRPADYSDIVILSRNSDNPELEKALQRRGIAVLKETGRGFFGSLEVRLAKDLFAIIDNPYRDIEFAAVLHSPLVGLSASELAEIKLSDNLNDDNCGRYEAFDSLYEICLRIVSNPGSSSVIRRKVSGFMMLLSDFRNRAFYMDLYDFVQFVFDKSGLCNVVLAMPQGDVRQNNLTRLKEMAGEYSENNHEGLFGFIRNLHRQIELGLDEGQSSDFAAHAVKMMTIHKAKGLEFPIVILADAGRGFNESDSRDEIVIDKKFGAGLSYRDIENKIRESTLLKEMLKQRKKSQNVAEEARLLYVALTRAKEKLIIYGSENSLLKEDRSLGSLPSEWELLASEDSEKFPADRIIKCNSYLKLIGAAIAGRNLSGVSYSIISVGEAKVRRILKIRNLSKMREILEAAALSCNEDQSLAFRLDYKYPYEEAAGTTVKRTASSLVEHNSASVEDTGVSGNNEINGGVIRGNAYHKVFELLDYSLQDPNSDLEAAAAGVDNQIKNMVGSGRLSEEYAAAVDSADIAKFISSDLGRRMALAASKGDLFRERQFVKGDKVLIGENEETLLMQGVIDAFFIEDGRAILVDYKTDRGKSAEELISMYLPQQLEYKDAITRALSIPVSEMYLYSTALSRAISLV